jgi:phenylacetate-CoA ligase
MMRLLRYRHDRRRHPTRYALFEQLLPVLRQGREQVLRRQQHDLDAIVDHAVRHTDFYAEHLGPAYSPGNGPVDSSRLPMLTKQQVADNLEAMLAHGTDPLRVRIGHTGGSTGRPLAFYYDDAKHELMLAGMLRGFTLSGWRPGQRVLYFWGASRDVSNDGVLARRDRGFLAVEKSVGATQFSEARLHEWSQLIMTWRPALLYGYASVLSELARFVIDSRLDLPGTLMGVYATAEVLHERQRQQIQQAFRCKVFNQYGCREVPNIAWECRLGNMHVFADMVHLESVPLDGEDRLLVTSLTNRLMPFIRYELGDTGRLLEGDCDCGLPFPLMEMDVCRQNDLITTRGGKRIHPAYFNRLLYGLNRIRQYQWVQTGLDRLQLKLVCTEPLDAATLQAIRASLQRELDPQMTLQLMYCDVIPRGASGKHRFVIGLPERGPGV